MKQENHFKILGYLRFFNRLQKQEEILNTFFFVKVTQSLYS